MCQSPNTSLVRRTIDLNYENKQRAASLRWLLVNGAVLVLLSYDLWVWCGGCGACGRGAALVGGAEALLACVLLANCVQHASRVSLSRTARARTALSPAQQRLLGLKDSDLDSSFVVAAARPRPEEPDGRGEREEPGSVGARRYWRSSDSSPSPPRSPHSPHSPPPVAGGVAWRTGGRVSPDDFISDTRALAAYIRQQEAREAGGVGSAGGARLLATPPRPHQLAVLPERGSKETSEEDGGVGGAGGAPLWRRLHVDPRRLTEYNLNLRLWLHVTVVSRVARELEAGGVGGQHEALVSFLRPFADKQYVADRIKELSRGGCLSAYRWDKGGRGWSAPRPTDADLLYHLFVTYLDILAAGAFSARHVAAVGGVGGAAGDERLALRRARPLPALPPHYVLQVGAETLDVGGGRDNLLHTLLLFLACAARAGPKLCRLHLGPASLNMLWILGR